MQGPITSNNVRHFARVTEAAPKALLPASSSRSVSRSVLPYTEQRTQNSRAQVSIRKAAVDPPPQKKQVSPRNLSRRLVLSWLLRCVPP